MPYETFRQMINHELMPWLPYNRNEKFLRQIVYPLREHDTPEAWFAGLLRVFKTARRPLTPELEQEWQSFTALPVINPYTHRLTSIWEPLFGQRPPGDFYLELLLYGSIKYLDKIYRLTQGNLMTPELRHSVFAFHRHGSVLMQQALQQGVNHPEWAMLMNQLTLCLRTAILFNMAIHKDHLKFTFNDSSPDETAITGLMEPLPGPPDDQTLAFGKRLDNFVQETCQIIFAAGGKELAQAAPEENNEDATGDRLLTPQAEGNPEWMNTAEACRFLGIGRHKLGKFAQNGEIPKYNFTKNNSYLKADLQEFLTKNKLNRKK